MLDGEEQQDGNIDNQMNKAEMFISMAFQDVDASGKVANTQAQAAAPTTQDAAVEKTEADRDEELARSVIEDD